MKELCAVIDGAEKKLKAGTDETLLDVFRRYGIPVSAPCGGKGTCRKCTVIADGREVLACRTPADEVTAVSLRTEENSRLLSQTVPAREYTARKGTGAAVDLGTTSIAVKVYDLESGRELGSDARWNVQRAYGADVISRIQYTLDHADGLQHLQSILHEQIMDMVGTVSPEVQEMVIAGNTVMEHIAAGISPGTIASAPFIPETRFLEDRNDTVGGIPAYYVPCVAGYVGGDIVAGLLSIGEVTGNALFLDIGTNGEMVLIHNGGMLACAVACGPAFEGGNISCGMPGTAGAVQKAVMKDTLELDVIGSAAVKGVCGSGLIDLIAVLVEQGVIDSFGRLLPPEEAPSGWQAYLEEDENGNGRFRIAGNVWLTAGDVRQVQLAKAAAAAGIEILLDTAGLKPEEIGTVLLAGGFGCSLDPSSAEAIGMFPEGFAAKTRTVGDASLSGAAMTLLKEDSRYRLQEIVDQCRYLELSGHPAFNRIYTEHMLFGEEEELWN